LEQKPILSEKKYSLLPNLVSAASDVEFMTWSGGGFPRTTGHGH
jgi:hypothetical protein